MEKGKPSLLPNHLESLSIYSSTRLAFLCTCQVKIAPFTLGQIVWSHVFYILLQLCGACGNFGCQKSYQKNIIACSSCLFQDLTSIQMCKEISGKNCVHFVTDVIQDCYFDNTAGRLYRRTGNFLHVFYRMKIGMLRTFSNPKFAKNSWTRIAYGQKSRRFPVLQ